ncbi:MAG: CinA family protein [Aquificae bacterium]|nr:CinA family protein [Aquificota bacterium]
MKSLYEHLCSCEVPKGAKHILRTFELPPPKAHELLRGLKYELITSPCGTDILFPDEEDFKKAKKILRPYTYTDKPEHIEETLAKLLKEKKLTLSCAESCTAGLLSARIVNVPGSSAYFIGGFVVYSNDLKEKYLGVSKETLKKYGAVSRQTCVQMLKGLKRELNTACGIAITGIAGPGGSEKKPQGLTYIGIYAKNKLTVIRRVFPYDRNANRIASTQSAMFYLIKLIRNL